jgi:hypothetical protein
MVCLVGAASPGVRSAEPESLPSFRVTSPRSTSVESSALLTRDRWLLVYVAPQCVPCGTLLASLKGWKTPALMDRTVLLVGAEPAAAQAALAEALPRELAGLPWYADADAQAWTALRLTGVPVLLGVQNGKIAWRLSGILKDAKSLESIVRTWVEAPGP